MEGKIGLEEHFAITENHRGFARVSGRTDMARTEAPPDRPRWAHRAHGRARHGDDGAVAQCAGDPGNCRSRPRQRDRAPGQRCPGGARGAPARSLCRTRRAADAGFCGALANGFSQIHEPKTAVYYGLPQYRPFWALVERLDVPFYLHPRNPLPGLAMYEGHPWLLGPTWAFGVETATHALRLMGSGLFDEFPRLQIILGHMGEGLPYSMWRIDNRNNWAKVPHACPAKKKMAEYFCANFHLTTAGNFRSQTPIDAILEIGVERVLFSTDYPFEDVSDAADWFDTAPIAEPDRRRIGRLNAIALFKLPLQ